MRRRGPRFPAELGFLRGLSIYRSVAWAWMCSVALLNHDEWRAGRGWIAWSLLGAALVVTVAGAGHVGPGRTEAGAAPAPWVVGEVLVGAALITATGWVYGLEHVDGGGASLGTAWPTAGNLTAGIAFGPVAGGLAGAVIGGSRGLAFWTGGTDAVDRALVVSVTTSVVISSLNGIVAGLVVRLVGRAQREVAAVRAREQVARTLHDGVLQTLAVVQRRSADPALARLARDQEQELRRYLYGDPLDAAEDGHDDVGAALRAAAQRFEQSFDSQVRVVVADDLPPVAPDAVAAIRGAVAEALVNAGKHGSARQITVFAEPGDDCTVFCTVHDDGVGFDPSAASTGRGLPDSIRGRMAEVGGRAEIRSRPGAGTEVLLWLP
jgi:signal transduction histidine kinase